MCFAEMQKPMDQTPDQPHRLNLPAIEHTLRIVRQRFDVINRALQTRRDPMDDRVVRNIMDGYAYVDRAIAGKIDFLAPGNARHLLELNALVLCGADPAERANHAGHLSATEERFYDDMLGGIRDIVEWYALHREESVWRRAAGTYVRILSEPQLFIEGNHRTGALVMSYLLARESKPPFVLTVDNAKGYFDPSSVITKTKKSTISTMYRLPGIKKRFATFLEQQADPRFLLDHPDAGPGPGPRNGPTNGSGLEDWNSAAGSPAASLLNS